jgi:hypothetical protein
MHVVHEEILDVDMKAMLVCSDANASHKNAHNLHVVYMTILQYL